ncbi:MAG: prolyl oligopeptidase family serine peptidase [Simkaniaceae bacterium]|nr:prolyl oligopeptidase family serine peptidase [Candidatus Sacchlamyda saccharinae]
MKKSLLTHSLCLLLVTDPFSWLEDLESDKTKEWVAGQMALSDGYFQQTAKNSYISELLAQHTNFTSCATVVERSGKTFYCKRGPDQDTFALYVDDRLLIEPTGTLSLSGYSVDAKGERLCYCLSDSGSDVNTWKFLNIKTGEHYPDVLEGLKFCEPMWNDKGVYYTLFTGPEKKDQTIYYHKIGSREDKALYTTSEHIDLWDVVKGGRYLLISSGTILDIRNGFYLFDVEKLSLKELLAPRETSIEYEFERGDALYFTQDNQLLEVTDTEKVLIPKGKDLLQSAYRTKNTIFCNYLKDAASELRVYDFEGNYLSTPTLPGRGTIIGGNSETEDFTYLYTDYFTPPAIKPSAQQHPYVMEQRFYESTDGTQVPMFILYKKDTPLDGNRPTLLYGYGGFNASITPSYSPLILTWLDMGGVYASANLRGGGEYGDEWHEAGRKEKKQNVFNDFTSAAKALVAWGYTTHKKIAINGRSNGGLLVGACLTQRPDLFGAAIPQVGVLDMLNFHKHTIGWAWCTEFGTPDDPEDYQVLHSYSPYHNIQKEIAYPPTLITTADHDDRVVPFHSYKFAAALQQSKDTGAPHLLRIYPNSGHSASRSKELWMRENLDLLLFLQRELIDSDE